MQWEILAKLPNATVRRRGRFIVADLSCDHRAITTSALMGGESENLRHLVNHQCCEGKDHNSRFAEMMSAGDEAYHHQVCAEVDVPPERTAVMTTAANMNYAACISRRDLDVEVLAVATAGIETNATCAGDPANVREVSDGVASALPVGTINVIVLCNTPLSPAALARTVMTITEAKTSALQRLAAPSRYSAELATGTGTDQYCIAAPLEGARTLKFASPHLKFGEIIGTAVRDAVLEALRWQNGLEPSYTRSLFHALGRYGMKEATIFDQLSAWLDQSDLDLLQKNSKSVFYEPLVGAAAHATAAVLDRARHGTLPASAVKEALVLQAACIAASLAGKPERWPHYRAALHAATISEPIELVVHAIALGWSDKWRD
jgi:adenosylcobinamide amidohydrolase